MKFLRALATTVVLCALAAAAGAQTWTPLNNQPGADVGVMLQLRDGRILVHEEQSGNSSNWHILTPDATGSYINGTWSSGGKLPSGYAPWFFGSQVLLDGKTIVIEGGEYNNGSQDWTNLGAVGTISGSSINWTKNNPPSGWGNLGDAESVILANGTYMQANCCTAQNALYGGPNTWTATGSVKQSSNDESGFTLLSNDLVLTVDTKTSSCGGSQGSELYDQGTGAWSCGPNTPVKLYNPNDEELGAAVLMYNNQVIQFGGNVVATAIYDVASNTWSSGPTPPKNLDQADGPSALEPNGKVLAMLSPGLFQGGCQFVEYDPVANSITDTANPTDCPNDSSYVGHLMMLPTGQIMFTDFSGLVEIYTPAAGTVSGIAPTIDSVNSQINSPSTNNTLSGTQLNGLTENNAYGDDYQGATDYPLVRLVQVAAPNAVYYATTHDETTHSIAPNTSASTEFDVPAGLPSGSYTLSVVTNGIESSPVTVNVVAQADFSLTANPSSLSISQGSSGNSQITVVPVNGFSDSVTLNATGLPNGVTAQFSPNPTASTSTLTLTASATATKGTSTVTVSGTADGLTNTTTIQLTITTGSAPGVLLQPASLTFANTIVGNTSAGKSVTMTNNGNALLNITSIAASGDFAISSNTCSSTLAANASCKFKVTFTPTQTGTRTGAVTITDNAPNSPQAVSLTGTGTAGVTLTPASANFPKTAVGGTSAAKTFTLKNKGSQSVTGISASTSGDFAITGGTCGSTLAGDSSCTFTVVFQPTQSGTLTGSLRVSDSAAGSPQVSTLSGTGK